MTPPSTEIEVINALSLLAHKVAPNVFDLSSLQWHVSIRDQIVRAQLLMADLKAADPTMQSVLIVGMGAAGISAAMAACELGFAQVCVVDKADAPFALFRAVRSRFVGPFMYEWPSSFHADQGFPSHAGTPWQGQARSPLAWNSKQPIAADDLATALTTCLGTWLANRSAAGLSLPHLLVNADPGSVQSFAKQFAVTEGLRAKQASEGEAVLSSKAQFSPNSSASAEVWGSALGVVFPPDHRPDYLILAAGMGKETLAVPGSSLASPSFWANDTLKDPSTANQKVVVLGGGDGALQDALRALTSYDHPLSLVQDLELKPACRRALSAEMPALLDADRQMRQHAAWAKGSQGQAMVDRACQQAADRLAANAAVRRCVLGSISLGKGKVSLWVAGTHFDKAYLLNRFAIHLLWACYRKIARRPAGRMGFEVRFSRTVTDAWRPLLLTTKGAPLPSKPRRLTLLASSEHGPVLARADKVVVRFGVQRETIPGLQMLQLGVPNERDLKHRATLKGIELPFVAM